MTKAILKPFEVSEEEIGRLGAGDLVQGPHFPSERRQSDTIMKAVERRCKRCATPLPPSMARAAKFCSDACRIRYWHFRRRLERIARHREQDRQCARCGDPIHFWLRSDARYCSTQCRQLHHQRRKREASSRRHVSPPA